MYYVRCKGDKANRRWKVREAVSLKAAINEISHAMVTGSIGGKSTVTDHGPVESKTRVLADVIRVNSDNTEAQPYQTAY